MTRQKGRAEQYRDSESAVMPSLVAALKSTAFTICAAAVLLVLAAALAASFEDPASVTDILSYVTLTLSSVLGGVIAYFCGGGRERSVSLMSGGMFVLLLCVLAIAFDGINSPFYMLIGYAVSVGLHFLGAWLCSAMLRGKKKRRRPSYSA